MRYSLPSLLLLLGACLGGRVHVDEWTDIAVPQEVDVWTQGQHWRLYGVTVLLDSITGIPATAPLSCDSCRVGFPRSQIDSVVTRQHSELLKGIAAQSMALMYLFGIAAIPE
jgi:hypothetical protein